MEGIVRSVIDHPLVAMAVCLSALLLVYFLFRSLIKLALILILIAVVICGYFYLRHPESRPVNIKDAVEKVRVGAGKAVDQGKSVVDKGIDKGKDAIEKKRESADNLGKTLGGEGDAGNRQKP